jgi:4-hydroxy-tetrahydrodipicolinate reductase
VTDLRITQLSSGLTVATERVPGTLSVATGVWVAVGARDEPAATSGVSHFLEHLLFKGTERRSAIDISRTIDRCGGDINAFTTKEYTAYYCRLPERHAATGIDLLGDVLVDPSLRELDIDVERQVILEEIAMDDDSPDDVAQQRFAEQLFLDHPLGRDTAGDPDTVAAITEVDVRSFFEQHYTAGAMVVSVAGPGSHDEMLSMIGAAFANVRPGDGRIEREAPATTGQQVSVVDDTEQVHLVIGGRGLHRTDPDREALDVVNQVLGGGLSSRLFEQIREQRGLVYSVYSSTASFSDTGSYSISTSTHPRHADEVVSLVMAELRTLVADGITDDELDIARGYLTGSYELALEDSGARMSRLGGQLTVLGRVRSIEEQIGRWQAVTLDDARRVIDRVYANPWLAVTLGPAFGRSGSRPGTFGIMTAASSPIPPPRRRVRRRRPHGHGELRRGRSRSVARARRRGGTHLGRRAAIGRDDLFGAAGVRRCRVRRGGRRHRRRRVSHHVPWLAMHGIHAVVGTSGLDDHDVAMFREAFGDGPAHCVVAPNFAISAVLAMRFAEIAAPYFDTAEIIELHHDRKLDAPSGMATSTAKRMVAARGDVPWAVDPTQHETVAGARGGLIAGDDPVNGGVRVHAVRMRGMMAHQEVVLGTLGQTLTIRQDSYDRDSFMPGVLLACKHVADHPGVVVGLDRYLGI